MSVSHNNYHILTVSGYSPNSFDEAVKNAIMYGWEHHGPDGENEFSDFKSFDVIKMNGEIGDVSKCEIGYRATIAISAIHNDDHDHDHDH